MALGIQDRAVLVVHEDGAELRIEWAGDGEEAPSVEDLGWVDRGPEDTVGTVELRATDLLGKRGLRAGPWRSGNGSVRIARLRR